MCIGEEPVAAHYIRIGINLWEDHIMAVKSNIGIEHAKQWKASALLSASIFAGCLVIAVPVFAKVIDVPPKTGTAPVQPAYTTASDDAQVKAMQQKLETIQEQLNQMTSGLVNQSSSNAGMPLHGFFDADYGINSQGSALANPWIANPSGFFQGSLSFYMAPHFGDRVVALAEPNFELDKFDGSISVDIERLQIGYLFSDAATLWLGRFHTPYGYWNTAFHHGAQIQTTVLRPRFLDFEDTGGILPAHTLGLWGTGKVRAGSGKFTYDWYVGNGPKIVDAIDTTAGLGNPPTMPETPTTLYQTGGLDPNIAGDDNHSAMVGLNLGYDFSGMLDGLRLAVHWLNGNINAYGTSAYGTPTVYNTGILNTTNLNTGGASLVYLSNYWEIMGEYYGFNNKDITPGATTNGNKYKSRAGYMQVGLNIGLWTPYIRAERTTLDQNDNYFRMQANGQSYARQIMGVRYNLNPKACLKLELMNSHFMAEPTRTELSYRTMTIQYAIGF
jgi:hypothetical protein